MTYNAEKISNIDMPLRVNGKKDPSYKKEEPFFCKECDRVWQPLRDYGNIADYLLGFPKIGCTRRICKNCRKEKKNGTAKKD